MHVGRLRLSALGLCVLAGLAGCESCRAKPKFDAPQPLAADEAPVSNTGTLTGSIRLAPGYTLPSYRPEDMERRVLKHVEGGTFPEACSPPKQTDRTPVLEGPGGKLVGVLVAASEFSTKITRPAKVHDVVIKDCRLTPRVVAGQLGDMLNLKNEVQFPFMPTYGPNAYNETLTPGQNKALRMDKAGVDNVLCGFTAPCGRTDVIVLRHPVFTVTEASGDFKIENFPADETVRVSAWHPLFKDEAISVKVGRGETKNVEIVITPLPQAPPTPQPASADPAAPDEANPAAPDRKSKRQ
jgi:hypothetical protein